MGRSCVFCGYTGKLTREDAWPPRWMLSVMPKGMRWRVVSERWEQVISDREVPHPEVAVAVVCGSCNNGWMSRVQTDAKPVLAKMMRGWRIPLWTPDQTALTNWVAMTAMVLEFTSDPTREPFFTHQERLAFAQSGDLPGFPFVVAGSYKGPVQWKAKDRDLTLAPQGGGPPYRGYQVGFCAGQAILLLLASHAPAPPQQVWPTELRGGLVPIWPIRDIQTWPPELSMDAIARDRLFGADSALGERAS